jgi:hypothetical protein
MAATGSWKSGGADASLERGPLARSAGRAGAESGFPALQRVGADRVE